MPRLALASATAIALLVTAAAASAATPRKVFFEDTLTNGVSSRITIDTHTRPSFRVVLRTRTVGRTRLFLTGATAPSGGPLIDTKTYACSGAAGSFYCQASYEPLPRGTYTFRIRRDGPPAHVELTIRW